MSEVHIAAQSVDNDGRCPYFFAIVDVIGGVIGLAVLIAGHFTGAVAILVVIPTFLAWYKLEQKS